MNDDRLRKIYIDRPAWDTPIKIDDFLVAVGRTQSNSVYHIAEVSPKQRERMVRYHLKVMKTDLLTALRRDNSQQLIPIFWYSREKKK